MGNYDPHKLRLWNDVQEAIAARSHTFAQCITHEDVLEEAGVIATEILALIFPETPPDGMHLCRTCGALNAYEPNVQ